MSHKRNSETHRTSVAVPEYQHETWKDEANEMNASTSEYVRMMVQAGRNELGYSESHATDSEETNDNIKSQVIEALQSHDGAANWDEVRNAVLGELEAEIEEAIEELEEEGTLKTSVSSSSIQLLE